MAVLPQTGITTSLVGNALGTTIRSVGALCKHDNINMWSKNKPFRAPVVTAVTDTQREYAHWGLEVVSANTIDNLIYQANQNSGKGVIYLKPEGGETQPYRLGDFRGYNPDATAPMENAYKNNTTKDVAAYANGWDATMPRENIQVDNVVSRDELYGESNLNYGVALTDTTGSNLRWAVGGIPWNQSAWNVHKGKKCLVYEFYTNLPLQTIGTSHIANATDKFFLLPTTKTQVTFTNTGSSASNYTDCRITASFTFDSLLNEVSGTIIMNSNDTSTTTYTGGTYSSVLVDFFTDNKMEYAVASWSQSNVVLGAETSITLNVSASVRNISTTQLFYSLATKASGSSTYTPRQTGMVAVSIGGGGEIPRT